MAEQNESGSVESEFRTFQQPDSEEAGPEAILGSSEVVRPKFGFVALMAPRRIRTLEIRLTASQLAVHPRPSHAGRHYAKAE